MAKALKPTPKPRVAPKARAVGRNALKVGGGAALSIGTSLASRAMYDSMQAPSAPAAEAPSSNVNPLVLGAGALAAGGLGVGLLSDGKKKKKKNKEASMGLEKFASAWEPSFEKSAFGWSDITSGLSKAYDQFGNAMSTAADYWKPRVSQALNTAGDYWGRHGIKGGVGAAANTVANDITSNSYVQAAGNAASSAGKALGTAGDYWSRNGIGGGLSAAGRGLVDTVKAPFQKWQQEQAEARQKWLAGQPLRDAVAANNAAQADLRDAVYMTHPVATFADAAATGVGNVSDYWGRNGLWGGIKGMGSYIADSMPTDQQAGSWLGSGLKTLGSWFS